MKKTTLIKNLLKSPPISVNSFKSTEKYLLTPTDANETQSGQQTLKIKMENINRSLNQEIRQRQFEFKELYKMVVDLQKSKKSKCKHNILVMERKNTTQQISHIPFTVLHNNQKTRKKQSIQEMEIAQKSLFSINDFSQLNVLRKESSEVNLMKKQKRKSKCGTIKSHKYLPGVNNSSQQLQPQNEEDDQSRTAEKFNLETTSSQLLSTSHTNFNFNFDHREIISPTKSIISNSTVLKVKEIEELQLKMNYFENKIKSLQASYEFVKEKVDTNVLRQADFNQQLKSLSYKFDKLITPQEQIKNKLEEIDRKMKETELFIKKEHNITNQQVETKFKYIQHVINQRNQNQMNKLKNQIGQIQKSQNKKFETFKIENSIFNDKIQSSLISEIMKVREEVLQNNKKVSVIGLIQDEFQRRIKELNIKLLEDFDQKQKTKEVNQQDKSNFEEEQFYSDKLSEVESRLQSTEQIVSQLMKVSLALTQKINKLDSSASKSKNQKQHKALLPTLPIKKGLSQQYWIIKEELNKIDEEAIESSRQLISESFLLEAQEELVQDNDPFRQDEE